MNSEIDILDTLCEHWRYPDLYSHLEISDFSTLNQRICCSRNEEYIPNTYRQRLSNELRQSYYYVKPILPRALQIYIRQKMVAFLKKRSIPAWPLDTFVEDCLYEATIELLSKIPGNELLTLSLWPGDFDGALVITHDVEDIDGYKRIEALTQIEERFNFRSAWYFVPRKYHVDPGLIRELQQKGFEVGLHGIYHDGKLFQSNRIFAERAKIINHYLAEWQEGGFRSPSLIRRLDWINEYLDIEYDTSFPTTELFGAQVGGCRTVFPFIYKNIVELPITLQQDHTLLEILKMSPMQVVNQWIETIGKIKKYQGMVLLIVHPDCMNNPARLDAYTEFLQRMSDEKLFWKALPKEVARWWKDRQSSQLVFTGDWTIHGKAHDRGKIMKISLDGTVSPHVYIQSTKLIINQDKANFLA